MKPFSQYIIEAAEGYRFSGANPTVDLVVFREAASGLEILLIKRRTDAVEGGKWAIPGGFVNTTAKRGEAWKNGTTEPIADAAVREMEEETGLKITGELRQAMRSVGTYKGGGRDPRDTDQAWSISYAYTVTIPRGMGKNVRGTDDASDAKWFSVDRLPLLAFDHKDIITDALGTNKKAKQRKAFNQTNESRIVLFKDFLVEANRGLTAKKNEWDTLSIQQVRGNTDVQHDIFNIISAAYAPLGGHPDFPNADSVPADNNITDVIDTDPQDDVDAAVLSKTTPFGKKMTTIASDGGTEAKREVLKKAVDILNTPGSYVEASGKIFDILVARGAPVVKDEATVRHVLKGKEIQWQGDDGSYSRKIGGKTHTKKMLGKPRV